MKLVTALRDNIHTVLHGQDDAVELAIICFLASGHLLIEDVPGVGKTTLASAFSQSLGLSYQRLQFTSDILPSDILGVNIYDPKTSEFVFHEGPIFTNILLADEINLAEPRASGKSGWQNASIAGTVYGYCDTESRRFFGHISASG